MKPARVKTKSAYVEPDNFPYFCEFELHIYAEQENYEALKAMLEEFPTYVNCVNSKGYTPLAVVTKTIWELNTETEKRIMELLLSHGADPLMPHYDGQPIALHAFRNGDAEVLMIFAQYLEDIDTILGGYTPLHYAVSQCEYDLAKYCLDRNADIHQTYQENTTLVHVAVISHNYYLAPLLLDYGCDVNAKMSDGNTALHLAVAYNNGENAVKNLIKYGADVNAQNNQGDTPLNRLAPLRYFNYEAFEHLIKSRCDVNIPDYYGFTPLHKISYNFKFGKYDNKFKNACKNFVRTLLRRNANVFALTQYGDTVLDTALRSNRLELAEILVKHITPKLYGRHKETDLMLYSFSKHPKFRSIATKCVAEMSKLDRVIVGTNFTYRDLTTNYRKIVRCATNQNVADEISRMIHKKRRLYGEELIEECIKVLDMAKMLILLTEIFEYVLPEPCIDKILEYINPQDCVQTFRPKMKVQNRKLNHRRYRYH